MNCRVAQGYAPCPGCGKMVVVRQHSGRQPKSGLCRGCWTAARASTAHRCLDCGVKLKTKHKADGTVTVRCLSCHLKANPTNRPQCLDCRVAISYGAVRCRGCKTIHASQLAREAATPLTTPTAGAKGACITCGTFYKSPHSLRCQSCWEIERREKAFCFQKADAQAQGIQEPSGPVSPTEVIVMEILEGFKVQFTPQYRLDRYVADFYLPKQKLIIEVLSHNYASRPRFRERISEKVTCFRQHGLRCLVLVGSGPAMALWREQIRGVLRPPQTKS